MWQSFLFSSSFLSWSSWLDPVPFVVVCLFSSFQKLPGFLGLWFSSSLSKLAKIKLSPYIRLLWTLPYLYLRTFCLPIIKPLWLHWVWPIIQNDLSISSEINHICRFALAISKVTFSQLLGIRMWTSLGAFILPRTLSVFRGWSTRGLFLITMQGNCFLVNKCKCFGQACLRFLAQRKSSFL